MNNTCEPATVVLSDDGTPGIVVTNMGSEPYVTTCTPSGEARTDGNLNNWTPIEIPYTSDGSEVVVFVEDVEEELREYLALHDGQAALSRSASEFLRLGAGARLAHRALCSAEEQRKRSERSRKNESVEKLLETLSCAGRSFHNKAEEIQTVYYLAGELPIALVDASKKRWKDIFVGYESVVRARLDSNSSPASVFAIEHNHGISEVVY